MRSKEEILNEISELEEELEIAVRTTADGVPIKLDNPVYIANQSGLYKVNPAYFTGNSFEDGSIHYRYNDSYSTPELAIKAYIDDQEELLDSYKASVAATVKNIKILKKRFADDLRKLNKS